MFDEIDLSAAMAVAPAEVEDLPILSRDPGTFDLSSVHLSLIPYQRHVELMSQEARSIIVVDTASQKFAVSAESRNKKLWKTLEQERKRILAPIQAHVKAIQNLFKTLQDPLASNETFIKGVRGRYEYQLELERRRREAKAREEQRWLQAKLDAEAREQRLEAERKVREAEEKLKAENDEATRVALEKEIAEETAAAAAPTPQAPLMTEAQKVVRTPEGSSYSKFSWKGRIVDPALVPRDLCSPDQKLIDAAVKGGVRQISGCIVEEITTLVTRV